VAAALRVLDALVATPPSVGAPMEICRIGPRGSALRPGRGRRLDRSASSASSPVRGRPV